MFSPGDVVLAKVQLEGRAETAGRPAVVLFEDYDSVIVAGVTSDPYARGIGISRKEGAKRDATIKLNYIFTVPRNALSSPLFRLTKEKKRLVFSELVKLLSGLQE